MKLKVFHEGEWKSYPAKSYEEYTYEWLGEPHASASVRYDTNGNETARNHVRDPRMPNPTLYHDGYIEDGIIIQPSGTSGNAHAQVRITGVDVGTSYAVRYLITNHTEDMTGDFRISVYTGQQYMPAEYIRIGPGESAVITEKNIFPGGSYLQPRIHANLGNGFRWEVSDPMVAFADTESAALAQVETYFDGDTPPDRAWVGFQPRNISGIKRIWPRSVTPPPPGVHYAWGGPVCGQETGR